MKELLLMTGIALDDRNEDFWLSEVASQISIHRVC